MKTKITDKQHDQEGTLLAPTNEAFRKLDQRKLDYILGHQKLRNELFGLHFVRERIDSTDKRLLANGELVWILPDNLKTFDNF